MLLASGIKFPTWVLEGTKNIQTIVAKVDFCIISLWRFCEEKTLTGNMEWEKRNCLLLVFFKRMNKLFLITRFSHWCIVRSSCIPLLSVWLCDWWERGLWCFHLLLCGNSMSVIKSLSAKVDMHFLCRFLLTSLRQSNIFFLFISQCRNLTWYLTNGLF